MRLLIASAFLLSIATPLTAQQWAVEAQAGRIRSALDPASTGFESLAVGVRYDAPNTLLRVSAGVPTASNEPLWAAVAGARRFAVRPSSFMAGVDVSGNAFALRDREKSNEEIGGVIPRPRPSVPEPAQSGYAAAFQLMPVVGFETLKVQAHLRGGVSYYTSDIAEQKRDRTATLADAQITFLPTSSLAIMPALRHFIVDEGDYTYGGVTAAFDAGAVDFWGSAGRWIGMSEPQDMTWAAGASVDVHQRLTLVASGRRDVFDPLYATPGQTAWSLGVSYKLGRVASRIPMPAIYDAGRATIRLPASQTQTAPRVAGDFNSWKPQPMQRSGDHWIYSVPLQPGVYNYAFVNANGEWFVPEQYPGRKQDGMGGVVAVLVVR